MSRSSRSRASAASGAFEQADKNSPSEDSPSPSALSNASRDAHCSSTFGPNQPNGSTMTAAAAPPMTTTAATATAIRGPQSRVAETSFMAFSSKSPSVAIIVGLRHKLTQACLAAALSPRRAGAQCEDTDETNLAKSNLRQREYDRATLCPNRRDDARSSSSPHRRSHARSRQGRA